ncbi:MAG: hypothetical protein K2J51_07535 [Alistipes sp.]|nr:hypothetical protein [Alistipes sp.]
MKRFLLLSVACLSVCALLFGCEKDDTPAEVRLKSITQDTFTYRGGLGSAVVETGGATVSATSSEPDWCRVQVLESTVLFNIISYTGEEDRSAVITIEAGNLTPMTLRITQTRFFGLVVMPTTLIFSDTERTLSVEVSASEDYEVRFSENPNNTFGFTKEISGVTFTANKAPGRTDVSGRAVLTPTDGGDPVIVSLLLPQRTVYDYLVGTWEASSGGYSFTFTKKEEQQSYNIVINHPSLGADYPITGEFVNGKVQIQCGQELGFNGSKYISLHYNGPINGQGTYIFTGKNAVAWGAEPEFNEAAKTIKLHLADNGQGRQNVAMFMAIWGCADSYFNFGGGSSIIVYEGSLDLVKSYTE